MDLGFQRLARARSERRFGSVTGLRPIRTRRRRERACVHASRLNLERLEIPQERAAIANTAAAPPHTACAPSTIIGNQTIKNFQQNAVINFQNLLTFQKVVFQYAWFPGKYQFILKTLRASQINR